MKLPKRIKRENVTIAVAAANGIGFLIVFILNAIPDAGVEIPPGLEQEVVALILGLFGISGTHHVAREHVRRQERRDQHAAAAPDQPDYDAMAEEKGD